ncbi:uncharacterized protein GGS22DRAFT_195555 [Annulohypoxylon maeteangense]|uniref:uncharacterized protein n=1 Tax=Annulohypoxylon maeteangense TaxID=1927788 RepID=UPI0020079D68|nr:uncharacterized protein GGS22DRAFT_195555 [Annulohypoxylon maeteangense]KAI0882825.1 hypothetical protein GGS22DRAFT_195555 [Annulohypoxylon maeteangense]
MTIENYRSPYNTYLPRQPVSGISETDFNTEDNINQSVSSMTDSQPERYYNDVSSDVSDCPGSDRGSEIGNRHSEYSTNVAQNTRLPIRDSLGISGCLIIAGGTLGSLLGLGFLIFLWTAHGSSSEAADAPMAWRKIMLNGWMGQATTLTALLIRIFTALQATVCTAMLASMFLEKRYVRKADVVQFSIIRAINDGPRKLTELIFYTPRAIFRIEAFLALFLTLGNLALQFTSTILFSDIQDATIVGFGSAVQVPNYINQVTDGIYIPVPEQESPTYRMFGELQSNASSAPDSNGFSDSGWKQRALIPLSLPDDRTAVRMFQGDTAVISSRVSCMRPNLNGTIRSANTSGVSDTQFHTGVFYGWLYYGSSLQDSHSDSSLCNPQGCYRLKYQCDIPAEYKDLSDTNIRLNYQSAFCSIGFVGGAIFDGHNHVGWQDSMVPWSNHSLINLVYSSNMLGTGWHDVQNNTYNISSLPSINDGEWTSFEILPGRFLNVSLCFLASSMDLKYVEMSAKAPLHEPVGNWSILETWDSSDVRTFLGADPLRQDHAERGILTITELEEPKSNSSSFNGSNIGKNGTMVQKTYGMLDWYFYLIMSGEVTDKYSWRGCIQCDSLGHGTHAGYSMLFEDTLLKTNLAAETLLCFTTALAFQWYTDFLSSLKGTVEVDIASTKSVQTAHLCKQRGCGGIISVALIIGFYLITVFITTALFIRQVSYSRQGNVWHAVSQLIGNELEEALENGNDRDDDDMGKWTKEDDKDTLVRLEKVDGRIQVVRKPEFPLQGATKSWNSWLPKFSKKEETGLGHE